MLKSAPAEAVLCARIGAVSESRTTGMFGLARRLREEGRDIISLAVGEPDFETPGPIVAATIEALARQHTRYGATQGLEALRSRLARDFEGCGADNVIVTNGAKQALYSLFQVLCDPGDEVIVPQPCWVSFCEQIRLAGGRPVPVGVEADHQLDPQRVRQALTSRTRAILVNSPNNPTGAVYPAETLAALARIAAEQGIYLISDEAYHVFVFDGLRQARPFDLAPEPGRVITVRSFSKHYNMTGFRLGYVVAAAEVIAALTRLQSHLCGNVCTFAQHGALAALEMDQEIVAQRVAALQELRDLAFRLSAAMFEAVRPQGAFYLFADVRRRLRPNQTSDQLAMQLLEKAGVAAVPGEAFGGPGHIRFSFGVSRAALQSAFERMNAFFAK